MSELALLGDSSTYLNVRVQQRLAYDVRGEAL